MTVLRRPNGPGGRSNHAPHNAPHHHQDPDPSPSSPHAAPAAPPVVAAQAAPQPRDQSFSDFLGPTVAFALAGGFYHFDYHSVTPGSLLLEAQTQPGQTGVQWFGNRVLNTFLVEEQSARRWVRLSFG